MRQATLLLLLLIFSFYTAIAQTTAESYTQKIIGEWTISKTGSKTIEKDGSSKVLETVCNVCPIVNFTAEQNAVIKNKSDYTEIYLWRITGNKISFMPIGATQSQSHPGILATEYDLNFTVEKDFIELELTVTDDKGSHSIILRK